MSNPFQQQLEQLEESYSSRALPEAEYKQQKWELLLACKAQNQMLQPVNKTKNKSEIQDSLGNPFCYIPSGPFIFGDASEYAELPAGIYIAKYPVTVKEFLTFVTKSGWNYPQEEIEQLRLVSPEDNCPVSHISWLDAKEYCRWLRKKTFEYYSLPSELEWEIAARGIDGRMFPWGYEQPDPHVACFHHSDSIDSTVAIGSYPMNKSPFGCMDMAGNVWEWCVDEIEDPRNPHILRGGSWCNQIEFTNCISRTFAYPPEKRVDYGGFRLLYLPNNLLAEYKKQMEVDNAAPRKASLKVISAAPVSATVTPDQADVDEAGKPTLKKIATAPVDMPAASAGASAPNIKASHFPTFPGREKQSTPARPSSGARRSAGVAPLSKASLEEMGIKFRKKGDPEPAPRTGSTMTMKSAASDLEFIEDDPLANAIGEDAQKLLRSKGSVKRPGASDNDLSDPAFSDDPTQASFSSLSESFIPGYRQPSFDPPKMTTLTYALAVIWSVLIFMLFTIMVYKAIVS